LAGVVAMQSSGVLGHRALRPPDRHGKHKRVEPWVIEPLTDVAAGGEHTARAIRAEQLLGAPTSPDADATVEHDEPIGVRFERSSQRSEVLATFGEHEGKATLSKLAENVVSDSRYAFGIARDRPQDLLYAGLVG
jgi:hypothetical protein